MIAPRRSLLFAALATVATSSLAAESQLFFRDSYSIESRSWRAEGRVNYQKVLDLPESICLTDEPCERSLPFSHVVAFDLFEDVLTRRGDSREIERESRALVRHYLAFDGLSDENQIDRLFAEGFELAPQLADSGKTFGMIQLGRREFVDSHRLLMCSVIDGRADCLYVQSDDDPRNRMRTVLEPADLVDQFERLLRSKQPEVRTSPSRTTLSESWEISLDVSDSLAGFTWQDAIVLPASILDERGVMQSTPDENGVHRMQPARLDLAGRPMWVTRWNVSYALRTHGRAPEDTLDERTQIVALVPYRVTEGPQVDQAAPLDSSIEINVDELLEVNRENLEQLGFREWSVNFDDAAGFFVQVRCLSDTEAFYEIPSMGYEAPITNAEQVCRVLRDTLN